MDDFFDQIVWIMLLAAIPAGLIMLLFRIFYGSFKGIPETKSILTEKRVYLPVALGSFTLMIWIFYSIFHIRSWTITNSGAAVLLATMAPVFKANLRTTWKNTIYLCYAFTLASVLVYFAMFALVASLA